MLLNTFTLVAIFNKIITLQLDYLETVKLNSFRLSTKYYIVNVYTFYESSNLNIVHIFMLCCILHMLHWLKRFEINKKKISKNKRYFVRYVSTVFHYLASRTGRRISALSCICLILSLKTNLYIL